jgi:formylglycine-generating enzyme required for sulfatase activity
MTFCLVDGSILSAPFHPHATEPAVGTPNTEPPETQLMNEPELSSPKSGRATQTSPIEQPASTVASDAFLPVTTDLKLTRASTRNSAEQSPIKTIVASLPEPIFAGNQPAALSDSGVASKANRWPILIGAVAVCTVVVVGVLWLVQRAKSHQTLAASALTEKAKNGPGITGAVFTEKANGSEIALVSIAGGSFVMGSPPSDTARDQDEGPQTNVTVPNFYMSKFEITQAQYRAVMGTNPSNFKGDDLPVDSVSWNDAMEFCRKLSASTGRTYRLPTEAEWEYAARAGANSPAVSNVDALGWCGGNSNRRTHPVGQKQANALGLYDMYGNVWEWCQSEYKAYPYQAGDGRESPNANAIHVLRGGSWEAATKACRPTYRRRVLPDPSTSGFRIVLAT